MKNVPPISHGIEAKPHTPVYKMHRYFARRPHNVFRYLIEHYTDEGDIILDPFCGGGVTVVEGLKLRRKVIGVDINPMATFITKMEVMPVDLDALKATFKQVEIKVKDRINELYRCGCTACGSDQAIAEWFEWSNVIECPTCENDVILAYTKKLGPGKYRCPECLKDFRASKGVRKGDYMIRLKYRCGCGARQEREVTDEDREQYREIEESFDDVVEREGLWYPRDEIPDCNMQRESALFDKGITHFWKLFTKRNLLANAILRKAIEDMELPVNLYEMVMFAFSASLRYTNNMVFRNEGWQGGKPIEWARAAFWLPDVKIEENAWSAIENRFRSVVHGKSYSQSEIDHSVILATAQSDPVGSKSCVIWTRSASKLDLGDSSIDAIITDPPYGGNVFYADLCNFWAIWLKDILGLSGLIDDCEEAVEARRDFPGAKGLEDYENLLLNVFKECYRVLKLNGYLVLTFHNKDPKVWLALINAVMQAGFHMPKDGVVYQDPIRNYTNTIQQRREGSVRGDFIYSFRKVDLSQIEIETFDIHSEFIEGKIVEAASGFLRTVRRASTSDVYRHVYQALIPLFVQSAQMKNQGGSKERIAEAEEFFKSQDLEHILEEHFRKTSDGMWELRDLNEYYIAVVLEAAYEALKSEDWITVDDVHQRIYTRLPAQHIGTLIDMKEHGDQFQPQMIEEILWDSDHLWDEGGRWRRATSEEQRRKQESASTRTKREVKRYLEGTLDRIPKDSELCEWIGFCYQNELYQEAVDLFQRVDAQFVEDDQYGKAKRIVEACRIRLEE